MTSDALLTASGKRETQEDAYGEGLRAAVENLTQIIDELHPSFGGETYQVVADKLNRIGEKKWTRRYILSVYNRTLMPSPRLARAIGILAAVLDGVPKEIAESRKVVVWAASGNITDGSYVLGKSRICARSGCVIVFVPNVPWRKYCGTCK